MFIVFHRFLWCRQQRSPCFHVQMVTARSVYMMNVIDNPHILNGWFQHNCCAGISEKGKGSPVFIVGNGRHFIGTHYNNFMVSSWFNKLCSSVQLFLLNCYLFLNDLFTPVISTFRTNMVVFHRCSAVWTCSKRWKGSFVMRTSFIPSGFWCSALWMCHNISILIIIPVF